jgi:hypothetical protein
LLLTGNLLYAVSALVGAYPVCRWQLRAGPDGPTRTQQRAVLHWGAASSLVAAASHAALGNAAGVVASVSWAVVLGVSARRLRS